MCLWNSRSAQRPTTPWAELIDLAEAHNPETHLAWERARRRADVLGVARSELYPTLAAIALSQTSRQRTYLNTRYYRQTLQSFDVAFNLNYTILDFGGRSGRIEAAKAELLDIGIRRLDSVSIPRVSMSR